MTNEQWNLLLKTVHGETPEQPVTGFIIDSPWLPGWAGVSNLQFYTSEEIWFQTNKKAIETFPDIIFLPGFWSEFGMCTEPSAFGAKLVWNQFNLPHADKIMSDISQAAASENSECKNRRTFTFCYSAARKLPEIPSENGT